MEKDGRAQHDDSVTPVPDPVVEISAPADVDAEVITITS